MDPFLPGDTWGKTDGGSKGRRPRHVGQRRIANADGLQHASAGDPMPRVIAGWKESSDQLKSSCTGFSRPQCLVPKRPPRPGLPGRRHQS